MTSADLYDVFEQAVRRRPRWPAVQDSAGRARSYAELERLVEGMAEQLHARGVQAGDRVAIVLPKSIESLTAILACLRLGAVYVPIAFRSPRERAQAIVRDAGVRVVVASEDLQLDESIQVCDGAAREAAHTGDTTTGSSIPPRARRHSDEPAYILYTSGSTGVPKGVTHSHASALSFVRWSLETFGLDERDRFSSHAPFHFDLSIFDIYAAFGAGGTLVLVDDDLSRDPRQLARFVAENRISVWYSAPTILSLLVEHGRLERFTCPDLRLVLFAGEVFPIAQLRRLTQLWPERRYFNLYGPTETNVCTYHPIPLPVREDQVVPFPIGRPCTNVTVRVLNECGAVVDRGTEGVLHVHATGPVMLGYWGRPDLDEQAFITDERGERWYCTGDVVVEEQGGVLVYRGRRDRMIKRHGNRIELGEIEAALHRHPAVLEVAAIAVEVNGAVSIDTYLSCRSAAPRPTVIDLKLFCSQHLLPYMIPDRFVIVDSLPKTSTDKIDYQGLARRARTT